jgi:mRNA-degrading endonuclease toxin of MazEF toxin-antitoxin module
VCDIPTEVPLGPEHRLEARSVANCDSLHTIPKDAVRRRSLGRLSTGEFRVLDRALRFALGIRG